MEDLRRVRYFIAVAEHLHFGRAAAALQITQPALSQQIKALERELGVELLIRDGRGVELTQAGHALANGAPDLLADAAALERATRAYAAGRAGELRLAFTRSGSDSDILNRIRTFRKEFPDITVSTITGWTAWNLELLESGEVDIAFVRGDITDRRIRTRLVSHEESAVVVWQDHPLAKKHSVHLLDIQNEPIVLWPRATGPEFYDELVGHIWGERIPHLVAEESDAEQVLDSVSNRTGISVLDRRRATRIAHDNVVVVPFETNPPRVALRIAWLRGPAWPTVSAFLDWWTAADEESRRLDLSQGAT